MHTGVGMYTSRDAGTGSGRQPFLEPYRYGTGTRTGAVPHFYATWSNGGTRLLNAPWRILAARHWHLRTFVEREHAADEATPKVIERDR